MKEIKINYAMCKGCSLCVDFCPKKILGISEEYNEKGYKVAKCIDIDKCISCGFCAIMCPESIIEVEK